MFIYGNAQGELGNIVRLATTLTVMMNDQCIIEYCDERWYTVMRGNCNKWCAFVGLYDAVVTVPANCIGKTFAMHQVFNAYELYAEYPMLQNMPVMFTDDWTHFGRFSRKNQCIVITAKCIAAGQAQLEQTVRHELQHAIQHLENIHTGSNKNWWRDRFAAANDAVKTRMRDFDMDELCQMAYTFTDGEIEARLAAEETDYQDYSCAVNCRMTDDELMNAMDAFEELKRIRSSMNHRWSNAERMMTCKQVAERLNQKS